MAHSRHRPAKLASTSRPADQVMQQWRDLREMLIRQLDMFEGGSLTLRSNDADVSSSAIADLKAGILEFDALISRDAAGSARA